MNEIDAFKDRVQAHGMMCAKYDEIWRNCNSKKQLFDMAVSAQGSETFCYAIANGWGIDLDFVKDKYKAYINDGYISEQDGYTSKMYVRFFEPMIATTTLVIVIGCDSSIEIPDNMVCEVRLVNSSIRFTGNGRCNVKLYGDCSVIYEANVIHHEI